MKQLLFKKLGIAQITLSQHPRDFLETGQVVLSNAGNASYISIQQTAVEKLNLPEELERMLIESIPGQRVLHTSNEYVLPRHLGESRREPGYTPQGKSWLGKTIAIGFMDQGLVGVDALDKDDDYRLLHQAMQGTGQHQTAPIDGLIRPHRGKEGTRP
jgi:hypothetical protein